MLRTTSQVMSAVIGGVNIVSVLEYDTKNSSKKNDSNRVANNVQLILKENLILTKSMTPQMVYILLKI